jgi:hypothetical protein
MLQSCVLLDFRKDVLDLRTSCVLSTRHVYWALCALYVYGKHIQRVAR